MKQSMIPIHMVPTFSTPVGKTLAYGLIPPLQTVSRHLAGAIERCGDSADGLRFHTNPGLLNRDVFEKTTRAIGLARNVLSDARRGGTLHVTKYEYDFFRLLIKSSAGTVERLAAEAEAPSETRRFENPWMFCDTPESKRRKAGVEFSRSSPLPQFFGLTLAGIAESALLAAGFKNPLSYDKKVADQVGIGALTALRIYEGKESLTRDPSRLLPHHIYRVEDMASSRRGDPRTRRIYVASSYLPVLYSGY